ncbi:ubiquitin-like domain-containing CTD phosphatase 1 [Heracleum sosnowskyi]|uniref:Mitochondrial import inner membrane translocase subunit TIM50 n=1 Tax=Heracleum sosnowskyi TaxID=360622 RepID=A0AAD8LY92_9APIA|nr:ubiquitin-like domain-containing CTD phosphatase 1 [Heracleum sosnowskyi]
MPMITTELKVVCLLMPAEDLQARPLKALIQPGVQVQDHCSVVLDVNGLLGDGGGALVEEMEVEAIHENEKLEPNKGKGIRQARVLEMSSEDPSSQDPPNEILAQKGDIIPYSQDVLNEIMGQKRDIVMKDASNSRRKLLVLDINGLLADIVEPIPRGNETFLRVGRKAVFKRPHCEDFMLFCLERFDVGIWSSRTKENVDSILARLLGYDIRFQLKFCWGQSNCTVTNFKTRESGNKFVMYKEIKKLSAIGGYDESNTLLVDDTPYKTYKNPPNTAIFPNTYNYKNLEDDSLGPEGDLRVYLEGLALAENVQEYVKNHPFGQRPIITKC